MMRRLAAGLAAAALGATVVATAATPALADPGFDGGHTRLQFDANPEPAWRGKPLLDDAQIDDVVAFLLTLK